MKTHIQLNLSKEELAELIREEVRATMEDFQERTDSKLGLKKDYFTRKETANILGITLPTLHKLTKEGLIISSRIGSSVRYAPRHIEEAMIQRKFKK
jgi:hypothetical protein